MIECHLMQHIIHRCSEEFVSDDTSIRQLTTVYEKSQRSPFAKLESHERLDLRIIQKVQLRGRIVTKSYRQGS